MTADPDRARVPDLRFPGSPAREVLPLHPANPSRTIMSPTDVACRSALAGAYSSEPHHSRARSTEGNSSSTSRLGSHVPSSRSGVAPLTRNRPPYWAMLIGDIFL